MTDGADPFDPRALDARRAAYFARVREAARQLFHPDGSYGPGVLPDARIAYWMLPAFMEGGDAGDREFGLRIYAAGAGWDGFDVFITSLIASHLHRWGEDLGGDLAARAREHLDRFAAPEPGKPGAAIYDYQFHGYNDNMPALAARTLLLGGEALGRTGWIEDGFELLRGLRAHFLRRGFLSECTSGTYTPITLCTLLDIAEHLADPEAAALARRCADRVLLDIVAHWHAPTGSTGGPSPRSYTVDLAQGLSVWNAYLWYATGSPACIPPAEALLDGTYAGPIHMARNAAFNLAQFTDVMRARHAAIDPRLRERLRDGLPLPRRVAGTTDWAETGRTGGSRPSLSRSYLAPSWWLGTLSTTHTGRDNGQARALQGTLARNLPVRRWEDRVGFWCGTWAGETDYGSPEPITAYVHSGGLSRGGAASGGFAEPDHVHDAGFYQTLQKEGSAMVAGALGPPEAWRGRAPLRFAFTMAAAGLGPDEAWGGENELREWAGEAGGFEWQFLRFGQVFLALRMAAMTHGRARPVRRAMRHGYLHLETPLDPDPAGPDGEAFREMADFGLLVEIADASAFPDFAAFRRRVAAGRWEFHHNFYRSCRYAGHRALFHLVDSAAGGTARFASIDGRIEEWPLFEADGISQKMVEFPEEPDTLGPVRTLPRGGAARSPFYDRPCQTILSEINRP